GLTRRNSRTRIPCKPCRRSWRRNNSYTPEGSRPDHPGKSDLRDYQYIRRNPDVPRHFPSGLPRRGQTGDHSLGAKLGPPWTGLPSDPKRAKETIDLQLANLEKESKNLEETRARIANENGPRIKAL